MGAWSEVNICERDKIASKIKTVKLAITQLNLISAGEDRGRSSGSKCIYLLPSPVLFSVMQSVPTYLSVSLCKLSFFSDLHKYAVLLELIENL